MSRGRTKKTKKKKKERKIKKRRLTKVSITIGILSSVIKFENRNSTKFCRGILKQVRDKKKTKNKKRIEFDSREKL